MKSIIYSSRVILATLCAASLMGATALAANTEHSSSERGTIASIDASAKTLTVKDRHSQTEQIFVWNDATKFLEKDHRLSKSRPATANDLKEGEYVRISYQKADNQMVAKTVVITPQHQKATAGSHS